MPSRRKRTMRMSHRARLRTVIHRRRRGPTEPFTGDPTPGPRRLTFHFDWYSRLGSNNNAAQSAPLSKILGYCSDTPLKRDVSQAAEAMSTRSFGVRTPRTKQYNHNLLVLIALRSESNALHRHDRALIGIAP